VNSLSLKNARPSSSRLLAIKSQSSCNEVCPPSFYFFY
jgi:hypothetical protein